MPFVEFSNDINDDIVADGRMKIMIFTEGSVLGHKNLSKIFRYDTYIPIGDCVNKIQSWALQGAEIVYVTSRKTEKQVGQISLLLSKYHFPGSRLYYREDKQKYKDIVELVRPDILIEDDCKSIGGQSQMCITYVETELKSKIKSAIIKEFEGIDNLPALISDF